MGQGDTCNNDKEKLYSDGVWGVGIDRYGTLPLIGLSIMSTKIKI